MLSYRHAYHAGNHADVLKHLVLTRCLQHMNAKDKPYTVIDTHAGAGLYALDTPQARQTGEYADGIGRLWACPDLPAPLQNLMSLLKQLNSGGNLRRYPGSPWLAAHLARSNDRLRLAELHSTDFAFLRRQFKDQAPRVMVEQADGFEMLKAALPPPSKRGLVLIDPSYEIKNDYTKVAHAIKDALQRFATGTYLVWHPLLPLLEAAQLPQKLKKSGATHWLHATLSVRAPSGKERGMHGSGMFVINPPWTLTAELKQTLPFLARALAQDTQSTWSVDGFEQKPG
jgi:23S rRNA (adenine2030-N6)-methyltransferase